MISVLLTLMLAGSPGPLDQFGGHYDPVTHEYHMHAGPSIQYRYYDARGHIWEGNGPLPDEPRQDSFRNTLWDTPLALYILFAAVLSAVLYGFVSSRLARWKRRRREHRAKRRAMRTA